MAEFDHRCLHADLSLFDGACDVDKLVKRVQDTEQTSVAITDHGYSGSPESSAAKSAGMSR